MFRVFFCRLLTLSLVFELQHRPWLTPADMADGLQPEAGEHILPFRTQALTRRLWLNPTTGADGANLPSGSSEKIYFLHFLPVVAELTEIKSTTGAKLITIRQSSASPEHCQALRQQACPNQHQSVCLLPESRTISSGLCCLITRLLGFTPCAS